MADTAMTALDIGSSIFKLGQVVVDYANFLIGVEDEVNKLKSELSYMKAFLKDASRRLENDFRVQQWVSDIRDLAHESEDLIDTFLLTIGEEEPPNAAPAPTKVGCFASMSRCFSSTTKLPTRHKIGLEVEGLMERAKEISLRGKRYGLRELKDVPDTSSTNREMETLKDLRRSTPYADDEHFIGQAEAIRLLKGKLTGGGSSRFVISLFGPGGLGKTTLARKLYNDLKQGHEFECQAWVCVSKEYNTRDLLFQLIKSFTGKSEEELKSMGTDISTMEGYLHEDVLKNKKYLVVVDDVWKKEAWDSLKRAFPDNNNGSRVIITTRVDSVATQSINKAFRYDLRPLTESESWNLFSTITFLRDGPTIPHLVELGKEMVARCAGLPIAIVTLGGILSRKLLRISEWEAVKDNMWKEMEKESVLINAIFSLSFNDLPDRLKPCFLYISMFPEDYEIDVSYLLWSWMAEGFIEHEEVGSPEDVASSYLRELVGRSLIQIADADMFEDNPITCRVHDLLRDLAIKKAKDIGFSRYFEGKAAFDSQMTHLSIRRQAVYCTCLPNGYLNPSLRTLLWKIPNDQSVVTELKSIHARFGLLRVFHVDQDRRHEELESYKLPSEIGRLIHLRYLNLSYNRVSELPDSIGELKSLQTLIVEYPKMVQLPKAMKNLKKLRHLIGRFSNCSVLENLSSMQTLNEVTVNEWVQMHVPEFSNLHHLYITYSEHYADMWPRISDNFNQLRSLRYLSLFTGNVPADSLPISKVFRQCPSITRLHMWGWPLNDPKAPHWADDLYVYAVNLQVVQLAMNPMYDPLPLFERLPKLRDLRFSILEKNLDEIVCSENGGFPQLETLRIGHYTRQPLNMVVADGAMPFLHLLHFRSIDGFIQVPDRMKHLKSVELVTY